MYKYYDFEVSLQEAKPRIWRRFLLHQKASFYELHQAIQVACGWEDSHLFAFRQESRGRVIAGIPDDDPFEETPSTPDAKKMRLEPYFNKFKSCLYEYDFGDGWMHDIVLVGTVELPYKFKRALMDGKRAFPPEDSGGIGGYERIIHVLVTGEDDWGEDPEDLLTWLNGWTPEKFELEKVKAKFDK